MPLTRREIVRLAGMALFATPFARFSKSAAMAERRLFFDLTDLPRIRANATGSLLGPTFQAWENVDPAETRAEIGRVLETQEFLSDLGQSVETLYRQVTLLLVTGDPRHEEMVLHGLDVLEQLPAWDYLLEAGEHVLGLMRASKATTCVLFAIEVLGDRLDESRKQQLLSHVAEKGCVPCALTLHQMDHPDQVVGWGVDSLHQEQYRYDMSRWPTILGNNNLRAIPTMGLGMGALALEGRDPRAAGWLDLAVRSAKTFLGLFEKDGSYFEGISYVDFAFRTMLMFLEAHYRTHGDVDWVEQANFRGITEYIVCLQNGLKEDGTPDVVNISDARNSVFPCVSSWIAKRNDDPLAQYAASHFSNPGFYSDFLWYDVDRPENPPPDDLLNKRMDLDWVIARTGWAPNDTVVAFRSGPPLNHEHADRNSIMVKAFGERLLTDPFGASYDPQAPHWLLRKTEAHNAVLIDGQGHQYHNGEEGTNASQASARIVAYEDNARIVSWSSDATEAYKLVRADVASVIRSVLFVKPGLLVMVDQLGMDAAEASLTVRLHPDNRDGRAEFDLGEGGDFEIRRPAGMIVGACRSSNDLVKRIGVLDLPQSYGIFPYLDIETARSAATTTVTALKLLPASGAGAPYPTVAQTPLGWRITAGEVTVEITESGGLPRFEVI